MFRILTTIGFATVTSVFVWSLRTPGRSLIHSKRYELETKVASQSTANVAQQEQKSTQLTSGQRIVVLALFVLLTPVITAPLANRILDSKSNTANLLLLFGYMGLDVLAAHIVGGVCVRGILSAILCMAALLVAFSYNLWICAYLARLRQT